MVASGVFAAAGCSQCRQVFERLAVTAPWYRRDTYNLELLQGRMVRMSSQIKF